MALDLEPIEEEATVGGLDLQPLEELNEQHPDITFKDRALIKNVGMQIGPDAVTRYLSQRGFEVDTPDGVTFRVKRPGELEWRRIDPEGFDVQDLTDIGGDVFKGVTSLAGGIVGGVTGAPSGVGAAVGGAGGAVAGGALAESALQGLGGLAGFGQTGGEATEAIKDEAILGAVLAPVGGAIGKAVGGVAKGVGGAAKRLLGRGGTEVAEEATEAAAAPAARPGTWRPTGVGGAEVFEEAAETATKEAPAPATTAAAKRRGIFGKAAYALGHPVRAAMEVLDEKVREATARSATNEAYAGRVASEIDRIGLEEPFEVDFKKRMTTKQARQAGLDSKDPTRMFRFSGEERSMRAQKSVPFDPAGPPTQRGFVRGNMQFDPRLGRPVSELRQYTPEEKYLRWAVDLDVPLEKAGDVGFRSINLPGVERLAAGGRDIPIPREVQASRASVIADMVGRAASAPYQQLGKVGGKFGLGPKSTAFLGGSMLPGLGGAGATAAAGAHFGVGKPAAWLARKLAADPELWINRLLGSAEVPERIKSMVTPLAQALTEHGPGRVQALAYVLLHRPEFRAWADQGGLLLAGEEGMAE